MEISIDLIADFVKMKMAEERIDPDDLEWVIEKEVREYLEFIMIDIIYAVKDRIEGKVEVENEGNS